MTAGSTDDDSSIGSRKMQIIEKIMARVEVDNVSSCWEWIGPHSGYGRGGGYPRMSLDGQTVAVHLVVYTHYHGYIPGKKQIDHKCRSRCCVNPRHLEMVTPKENARRRSMAKKKEATR